MSDAEKDLAAAFGDDSDLISGTNPIALFQEWLTLAHEKEINDANAMAVATLDKTGLPNVRMVLLKGFDAEGFVFYSNAGSQKGIELAGNTQAAAVLHWKTVRRQIRLRGPVTVVSAEEADEYFNSRPRASRIGAWASRQSRPLDSRLALKKAVAAQTSRFAAGPIPRPSYWTGFRIVPTYIEFWKDKPFRLHDRLVFQSEQPGADWMIQKLFP